MPRTPRIDWAGAIHHVMNRGVDRRPIFFGDEDRIEFGRRLADCHERFGVDVLAYCLMGNHYHLVLRTPGGDLSQAMHHLTTTYVRRTNDRVGRDGPLFRGRFTSIPVTTDSYLRQLVRYVHLNPLEIGVLAPEDHRWSSYRTYLGLRPRPSFLHLELVLGLFDHDRRRLAAFTTEAGPQPGIVPATADELVHVIRLALAMEIDGGRNRGEEAVLAALLDRVGDPRARELVADLVSYPTAAARRSARDRSMRRLQSDPALAGVVDRLVRHLSTRGAA